MKKVRNIKEICEFLIRPLEIGGGVSHLLTGTKYHLNLNEDNKKIKELAKALWINRKFLRVEDRISRLYPPAFKNIAIIFERRINEL